MASERRLHIGGKVRKQGWEIFNIVPAEVVDHVGDAKDLSRFPDNTFAELYASHILEHFDYIEETGNALREWKRVLVPGGRIYVSVPNLETLCELMAKKDFLSFDAKFQVMRVIYGGHMDKYDFHLAGFFPELLSRYLQMVGFEDITEVECFDLFKDGSTIRCAGVNISLNMFAVKPVENGV